MQSQLDAELQTLAVQVAQNLQTRQWVLATAESCTGGWIAQTITAVPGSSAWFDRGFVTYSNLSKQELLGVSEQSLASFGAVSEAVVKEMALGALARSRADLSVAVSGIAGPDGGSLNKPVGTVWLAWGRRDGHVKALGYRFAGDRTQVRAQAVRQALLGIIELITGK